MPLEPGSQGEPSAKLRGLSSASEAAHAGLNTPPPGRGLIWHPLTPPAIARQMLGPRHLCRASLPPGGEASQLQVRALEGFRSTLDPPPAPPLVPTGPPQRQPLKLALLPSGRVRRSRKAEGRGEVGFEG